MLGLLNIKANLVISCHSLVNSTWTHFIVFSLCFYFNRPDADQALETMTYCINKPLPVFSSSASFDATGCWPIKVNCVSHQRWRPTLFCLSFTPKTAELAGFLATTYSALSSQSQGALVTLAFRSLTQCNHSCCRCTSACCSLTWNMRQAHFRRCGFL